MRRSPVTSGPSNSSVLTSIKGTLAKLGLGMGDIVKMTIFMVADPANGDKSNFPGLIAG